MLYFPSHLEDLRAKVFGEWDTGLSNYYLIGKFENHCLRVKHGYHLRESYPPVD